MSKGEATRGAILDTASRLARSVGLGGITIGTLATSAALSKSGLYAHFRSKEALQVAVLEHTRARFVAEVMVPALARPRGEPRVRALFENWLTWDSQSGGCLFVAASSELDDQPGPARDLLVRYQRDWRDSLAEVFRTGLAEGHFRAGADPEQFAFELDGVMLSRHLASRLLAAPDSETRARRAFESLLDLARA
ncbi:TetR/AcrR family transcriptional regulator [Allokutzneria sp. A3M-2-11 16]|uniref:TetR/AcrR family transcriptional regulator n=1 Tax=Allokutzneria sp. A3M-2-11 16 TaxID=2962043 RepID=UPI0020B82E6B|nr:TetR/AcrR family transcriptional regulator [Allokutzneria sp. A3M-2-11 16]MCP3803296.1 TetR/AcrR family transcriptional regulator [Allokutzneria sp. A3M-2-11 16]